MEVKASLKYLRISPRKVRLVAKVVKGMPVTEAELQLNSIKNRSAKPLLKLLKSAISNAEHNFQLDRNNLFVKNLLINNGPVLKRFMPRARGVAYEIKKRTSHVDLILAEIKPSLIKKNVINEKPSEEISKKDNIKKISETKTQKAVLKEEPKIKNPVVPKQRIFRRKAV